VPTYQYACTDCADRLEVVQKFTDDALTVCPACGGRLRKIFSPVGIVFKGSGFYRTDSRSSQKPEPAAASANGAGSKDSGSKDSGSKDSDSKKADSAAGNGSSAASSGEASGSGGAKKNEKLGTGSPASSSGSKVA
jgi:putative FmdB family regulatory protein